MAKPLIASLPLDLVLASGYQVRFTALDPVTGNAVTGVRITDVAFQVRPVAHGPGGLDLVDAPLPLLVPVEDG